FDAKLRAKSGRSVAVVVAFASPHQRRGVPTGSENRGQRIFTFADLLRYVVHLVRDAQAVIGPSRTQNLIADAAPVQVKFIRAQGRGIEPRGFYRLRNGKAAAKDFYRVGGQRLAQDGAIHRGPGESINLRGVPPGI